jgi:hypothetical protein
MTYVEVLWLKGILRGTKHISGTQFEHCDDGKLMKEMLQEASYLGVEECSNSQWAYRTGTKLSMRQSAAMLLGVVPLSFTLL